MSFKIFLILFFVSKQAWVHALDSPPIFVRVREEVNSRVDGSVIPCDFKVCSGDDMPVSITWKVGSGPNDAETIATSTNYMRKTGKATDFRGDYTAAFTGRLSMRLEVPPALIIYPVDPETDNQNIWCEVQNNEDNEIGTDIKSTVVRVKGSDDERPKFNIVSLSDEIVDGFSGGSVTLDCSCDGSHCDNVGWHKGPYDKAGTVFEKVYEKHTLYKPNEPVITYGPGWEGRVSASGYSLTIHDLTQADAGRYWCRANGADFYSLGDSGYDAKSIVVTVDQPGVYVCPAEWN